MLSLAERLGKDLRRFGQGKRELKGLMGKRRKERRKEGIRTRQGFGELKYTMEKYSKSSLIFLNKTLSGKEKDRNLRSNDVVVIVP